MRIRSIRELLVTLIFAIVAMMVGSGLAFATERTNRRPPCSNTKCYSPISETCVFQLNTRCLIWNPADCSTEQCPL